MLFTMTRSAIFIETFQLTQTFGSGSNLKCIFMHLYSSHFSHRTTTEMLGCCCLRCFLLHICDVFFCIIIVGMPHTEQWECCFRFNWTESSSTLACRCHLRCNSTVTVATPHETYITMRKILSTLALTKDNFPNVESYFSTVDGQRDLLWNLCSVNVRFMLRELFL